MASMVGLLVVLFVSQAQPPTLDLVLARAGVFSTAFHRDCGRLIADESYVQLYSRTPSSAWLTRSLRSDFAMIADEHAAGWHTFRDVIEVDGEPVTGNAGGRLARVLLEPPQGNAAEATQIANESKRYLLGTATGVGNAPPLALMVLLPVQQPRFAFVKHGERTVGDVAAWVVEFKEVRGPGFFMETNGRDYPISGEFWIDPRNGVVLRSQFVVHNSIDGRPGSGWTLRPFPRIDNPRIIVEVFYKADPALAMTVPVEMRETYSQDWVGPVGGPVIDTAPVEHFTRAQLVSIATYTHYRRLPASVPTEAETRR